MDTAVLVFSETNLTCDWDWSEIALRLNPLLWLVNIDWNGTTLFWDSQVDKGVVYEYIECYVAISEIWLISLRTFEENLIQRITKIWDVSEIHSRRLGIVNTTEKIIFRLKAVLRAHGSLVYFPERRTRSWIYACVYSSWRTGSWTRIWLGDWVRRVWRPLVSDVVSSSAYWTHPRKPYRWQRANSSSVLQNQNTIYKYNIQKEPKNFSHKNYLLSTNEVARRWCYRSCVSVILSTGSSPCGAPSPVPLSRWHIETCSTWTSMYRPFSWHIHTCSTFDFSLQGTPSHTSSLWNMDCRKAGGWHSTKMPSCLCKGAISGWLKGTHHLVPWTWNNSQWFCCKK